MNRLEVAVVALVCATLGCSPEFRDRATAPTTAADGVRFEALASGAAVTARQSTGGVSRVDYDGDGDADLFVTNGYDVQQEEPVRQPNRLYRNAGGVLVPVQSGTLLEAEGFSSGSTWADYDNDGDLDVFVCNQRDQDNFLFRNDGGGQFTRITEGPVVNDSGQSYATAWVDVDNDGDLDLVVANWGSAPVLYLNDGASGFAAEPVDRLLADIAYASSLAGADLDRDGLVDLVIGNWPNRKGASEENVVLANRSPGGNWLEVELQGRTSNRAGIGARIEVRDPSVDNGRVLVREVQSHTGWRSQNDLVQHFGLGSADTVDITVRWPSGRTDTRSGVATNQRILIREGSM